MRGKVQSDFPELRSRWDHPRLCGEKVEHDPYYELIEGSPPPMRGKVQSNTDGLIIKRITPAYAGKRPPAGDSSTRHRDHPRLCGEKAEPRP